ncbi:TPA: transposase, partial [Klebsiella pneumoniae]|nr:transposase [Klebsiella pneumoniae]
LGCHFALSRNRPHIVHARKIINDWRQDYNECRPHSTLNYQTPSEFAAGWRKGHSENEDSDVTN